VPLEYGHHTHAGGIVIMRTVFVEWCTEISRFFVTLSGTMCSIIWELFKQVVSFIIREGY